MYFIYQKATLLKNKKSKKQNKQRKTEKLTARGFFNALSHDQKNYMIINDVHL